MEAFATVLQNPRHALCRCRTLGHFFSRGATLCHKMCTRCVRSCTVMLQTRDWTHHCRFENRHGVRIHQKKLLCDHDPRQIL